VAIIPGDDSPTSIQPDAWRRVVWAITNVFESGRAEGDPSALQTSDAGVISYGRHQATLASGALSRVIEIYLGLSQSDTSRTLDRQYRSRIGAKDATLRHDQRLRALLRSAAAEPEMQQAQDSVFESDYYQPAVSQARRHNISTPLGLACIYDTMVQGGLYILLPRVTQRLGGAIGEAGAEGIIDEESWIGTFLDLREQRLLDLAAQSTAAGDALNARALRNSAFRVREFRKLLESGNLSLQGELRIRDETVLGIQRDETSDPDQEESMKSNARFVTDITIPDDSPMEAGQSFDKSWQVQNNGSSDWGHGYKLVHIDGVPMSEKSEQDVPEVSSGDSAVLTVSMKAPMELGVQFSDWRLQDPQGQRFGDILYARILVEEPVEPEMTGSAASRFVADVTIPDDSQIKPQTSFVKTWRVENSGDLRWTDGFRLKFVGGTPMTTDVSHPLPRLDPGARGDISVEMKAPSVPGSYFGDWRMTDPQGVPFGDVVFLQIVVPSPAGDSLAAPLSQRDPLWKDKRLGFRGSTKSIGEWGCLITCLAMVANRYEHRVTPAQLNDAMLRKRGFIEPNLTKWNALNNVYSDIVYEGKVPSSTTILDRIDRSLERGNPVTVQVDFTRDTPYTDNDQHWVLIVGKDGDDYRINDPWLVPPQEASLRERYGRTGRPLHEAIISAIFYRWAKQSNPADPELPSDETRISAVPTLLQTGMNINPDAPNSNPMLNDDLKGMDWVRYVFKLAAREKPEERDDISKAFEQFDEIVARYNRMGLKSMIVLNQETVWGNAPWSGSQDWDQYADQLASVSSEIAKRYKRYGDRVAYEIWNEGDLPNNPASIFVEPEHFARLLRKVCATIRAVSPESPLIFGGLATGPEQGIAYLKRSLTALGGQWPVDAIGIHPYGRWGTRAPFDWAQHFGTLGQAFDLYRREIPDIPFWITEIGVAADSVIGPENYEAIGNYLRDVYKHVGERHLSLVPVVVWFAWSDWMRNAGIVDRDGQRKAHVYDAFRAVRNREL
jgi:hypothetical protein